MAAFITHVLPALHVVWASSLSSLRVNNETGIIFVFHANVNTDIHSRILSHSRVTVVIALASADAAKI